VTVCHEAPAPGRSCQRRQHNLSFEDALYVALAVVVDAPLVTAPARLTGADLPCPPCGL
jgi:predicted nucleic acid-binding protein